MNNDFQTATGKHPGEVIRDSVAFLSTPCIVNPERKIDLCTLLPELNMREQLAYALLSEALLQGWSMERAESFGRQIFASLLGNSRWERLLCAFQSRTSSEWDSYTKKYGNRFTLFDGSYWATALSLGIDCNGVETVLGYLRRFTVTLMEFAYMENQNPEKTYTWGYYESFRRMLDDLMKPSAKPVLPVTVRAMGGTAGKRNELGYPLSLGVDLENPDPEHTALNVDLDVTLKDKNGRVITVIKDRIPSISPKSVYHYGVTKQIRGAAVGRLSASVKALEYRILQNPLPRLRLLSASTRKNDDQIVLTGIMESDLPLLHLPAAIHYQFLSTDDKILGGGGLWHFEKIGEDGQLPLSVTLPVAIPNAAKVVLSSAFED